MSTDYKSAQPVRSPQDPDYRLQSKIIDFNNPALGLKVESDGSINVNGLVDVQATDFDIRDLAAATDSVSSWVKDGAGNSITSTTVGPDTGLDVYILNTLEISSTDLDIRDLVFATDKVDVSGSEVSLDAATLAALENITVSATDLDIRDLAFATDKVDASGSEVSLDAATLAALENITVSATDLDIRDLSAATDSVSAWLKDEAGNAFSISNPLAVTVVNQPTEGTAVTELLETAALAADASETLTYTVPASKIFYLAGFFLAASGSAKFEMKVNGTSKAVAFVSSSTPNQPVEFYEDITAAAGQTVTIVATNRDESSQSLYATIMGELRDV
jgi:hypothetical protein